MCAHKIQSYSLLVIAQMRALALVAALFSAAMVSVVSGQYQPNWNSLMTRPLPQWYDQAKVRFRLFTSVDPRRGFLLRRLMRILLSKTIANATLIAIFVCILSDLVDSNSSDAIPSVQCSLSFAFFPGTSLESSFTGVSSLCRRTRMSKSIHGNAILFLQRQSTHYSRSQVVLVSPGPPRTAAS